MAKNRGKATTTPTAAYRNAETKNNGLTFNCTRTTGAAGQTGRTGRAGSNQRQSTNNTAAPTTIKGSVGSSWRTGGDRGARGSCGGGTSKSIRARKLLQLFSWTAWTHRACQSGRQQRKCGDRCGKKENRTARKSFAHRADFPSKIFIHCMWATQTEFLI